jgi:hypothetical protein
MDGGGKFEIRNSKFEKDDSRITAAGDGVERIWNVNGRLLARQKFRISNFEFRIEVFHWDWILAEVH